MISVLPYAEFKLETEQYLKDLEQADTKKFQEVIDYINFLKENPS